MRKKKIKNKKEKRKDRRLKRSYKFDSQIANLFKIPKTIVNSFPHKLNNGWFKSTVTHQNVHQNKFQLTKIDEEAEDDKNQEETKVRSFQVKLFPSAAQKNILRKWFLINRYAYNIALRKAHSQKEYNFRKLRDIVRTEISENRSMSRLIKKYKFPSHSIDYMVHRVATGFKSAFTNLRNGHIRTFRIRPIKDSKKKETLVLESLAFSKISNTFCSSTMGKDFKSDKSLKGIQKESKLTWDKHRNQYCIWVPFEMEMKKVEAQKEVIALDMGARKFATGYDENSLIQIGTNNEKIKEKFQRLDYLSSRRKKYPKDLQLKKKYFATYRKLENQVNDLHWKTCKHLCENYNTIVIGKLSTKEAVKNKKEKNRVMPITKRVLLHLRHYEFRKRLKCKCEEYGRNFVEIPEHQTSMKCSNCGNIKTDLGSNETYNCLSCGLIIDRAGNSAKNMLVKAITDSKLTVAKK